MLTVLPFTDDIRFPGVPGAMSAAGTDVSGAERAGQPTPSVKQLQDALTLAELPVDRDELPKPLAVTDALGADVDGVVGAGLWPQLHVRRDTTANPSVDIRFMKYPLDIWLP